jgi:hypothetical protein
MRRRKHVVVAAAALVALAALLAVVLRPSHEAAVRPIRVGAVLMPRTPLFGDTVTARVDFAADTRRVVPGSVRIEGRFAPFRPVAKPLVERKGTGTTEYVVWTARLRCLGKTCLPKQSERRMTFPPVHISYVAAGTRPAASKSLEVRWPALIVYSRIDPVEVEQTDPRDEPPWRADLASLLSVSFDVPPRLSAAALYGAGGLLLLGAAALVVPLRRRELEPVVVPEEVVPEALPETQFEHALALLERQPTRDESGDARRRALEFVAAELARRGKPDLEESARRLAWAQRTPSVADAAALARAARDAVRTRSLA